MENSEGISFGAHQMRDGVSLNEQRKNKAVISYTEFMSLPDLSAYIKLPEDYPITRISFSYKEIENRHMAFVPKPAEQKDPELEDTSHLDEKKEEGPPEEDEDLDQENTNKNTQKNFEEKEEG